MFIEMQQQTTQPSITTSKTSVSDTLICLQEFIMATQDTFNLTLGAQYHRERWAEAAPAPDDLEGPHRQCRFQGYRHFVLWQ